MPKFQSSPRARRCLRAARQQQQRSEADEEDSGATDIDSRSGSGSERDAPRAMMMMNTDDPAITTKRAAPYQQHRRGPHTVIISGLLATKRLLEEKKKAGMALMAAAGAETHAVAHVRDDAETQRQLQILRLQNHELAKKVVALEGGQEFAYRLRTLRNERDAAERRAREATEVAWYMFAGKQGFPPFVAAAAATAFAKQGLPVAAPEKIAADTQQQS